MISILHLALFIVLQIATELTKVLLHLGDKYFTPDFIYCITDSCNNVAPVTNLCLGRATTRSHSSQWSKKKVAVET